MLYLIDYGQRLLVPMGGPGIPVREPVPVDGTMPGRVFTLGQPIDTTAPARVWLPIVDGTERLGVLELVLRPATRRGVSWRRRGDDVMLASLFAELIVARRAYGDAIEHHGDANRCRSPPKSCGACCRR